MNELFTAIWNIFIANPLEGFYLAVGGRMHKYVAPQESTFPYSVFQIVGDDTDFDFTDTREEITIQFDVYSQDNSNTEAGNLIQSLKDMFDNAQLSVSGWNVISWTRQNPARPKNDFKQVTPIQGYYVEYDIILEKQRNC